MRKDACAGALVRLGDVAGLRPLGTVDDFEFDRLPLLQRPEPGPLDGGEVHEHVSYPIRAR